MSIALGLRKTCTNSRERLVFKMNRRTGHGQLEIAGQLELICPTINYSSNRLTEGWR
jgi:hypothetical protein